MRPLSPHAPTHPLPSLVPRTPLVSPAPRSAHPRRRHRDRGSRLPGRRPAPACPSAQVVSGVARRGREAEVRRRRGAGVVAAVETGARRRAGPAWLNDWAPPVRAYAF